MIKLIIWSSSGKSGKIFYYAREHSGIPSFVHYAALLNRFSVDTVGLSDHNVNNVFWCMWQADSCEWKHIDKRSYCKPCSEERIRLRKRRALEEISANPIKKRRPAQTNWRCKSCGPAVRMRIADEHFIVTLSHNIMSYHQHHVKMKILHKGAISEVWLVELRFVVSIRMTMW